MNAVAFVIGVLIVTITPLLKANAKTRAECAWEITAKYPFELLSMKSVDPKLCVFGPAVLRETGSPPLEPRRNSIARGWMYLLAIE